MGGGSKRLGEFERIEKYLTPLSAKEPGALNLTDDAALLTLGDMAGLVVATDALAEGVHFLADTAPELIARKALRSNLSDLAAMGATPWVYTLALALGTARQGAAADAWVAGLAKGLAEDQDAFGITLVGGDSVHTPDDTTLLSITVLGRRHEAGALTRSAAKDGDDIYVSGTIGDAAAGLALLQGNAAKVEAGPRDFLIARHHLPSPRLLLGAGLVGVAHAAIDISDGLVQDMGHIAAASGVAARITAASVPVSPALKAFRAEAGTSVAASLADTLTGGDDYELLFTAPPDRRPDIERIARKAKTAVTRIGSIEAGAGVTVEDAQGAPMVFAQGGYQHP